LLAISLFLSFEWKYTYRKHQCGNSGLAYPTGFVFWQRYQLLFGMITQFSLSCRLFVTLIFFALGWNYRYFGSCS
jgi:hypothetical protein